DRARAGSGSSSEERFAQPVAACVRTACRIGARGRRRKRKRPRVAVEPPPAQIPRTPEPTTRGMAEASGISTGDCATLAIDARGRIASADASAERIFGHAVDALVGGSVDVLIPERLRVPYLAALRHY